MTIAGRDCEVKGGFFKKLRYIKKQLHTNESHTIQRKQ